MEKRAISECGRIRKYIDRERIVRLWEYGNWTQESIAQVCKCSIATVRKVLREEGFEEVFTLFDGSVVKKIWHERVPEWRKDNAGSI